MVNRLIDNTENLFHAILDLIKKMIKGMILSFLVIFIGMFIDISFGPAAWRSDYLLPLVLLIIPVYPMIRKFGHTNVYYVLGWVAGVFVFASFGLLSTLRIQLYIVVPIAIFIIKFLWGIIFPRKN